MMMVTTTKMLGNLGLYLCIVLSVNVPGISSQTVIEFQTNSITASEGDGGFNVNVCLNPMVPASFNIKYNLTILTMSATDDITVTSDGSIEIGNVCDPVTIAITDDNFDESTETFTIQLVSDTSRINVNSLKGVLSVVVKDNDPPMTPKIGFTSQETTVAEDVGTTSVDVCVSNGVPLLNFVSFSLTPSPASPGNYDVPTSGTILANTRCTTLTITVIDDDIVEPEGHRFTLFILSVTSMNAEIDFDSNSYIVDIDDDDLAQIGFNEASIIVLENVLTINPGVCFKNVVSLSTSVTFNLIHSPASPGNYSVPTSGSILANTRCTTLSITVIDDDIVEPEGHQFTVFIVSVTSTNVEVDSGSSSYRVDINDDDLARIGTCPQTEVITSGRQVEFRPPSCYDSSGNFVEESTCNPPSGTFFTTSTTVTCQCSLQPSFQCTFNVTLSQVFVLGINRVKRSGDGSSSPADITTAEPGTDVTIIDGTTDSGTTSVPRSSTTTTPTPELGTTASMTTTTPELGTTPVPSTAPATPEFSAVPSPSPTTPGLDTTPVPSTSPATPELTAVPSSLSTTPEFNTTFIPRTAPTTAELTTVPSPSTTTPELNTTSVPSTAPTTSEFNTTSIPSTAPTTSGLSTVPSLSPTTSELNTTYVPSTAPTTPELSTAPSPSPTTPAPGPNCETNGHECGESATCEDIPNGINCTCKDGFYFDFFIPPATSNCTACGSTMYGFNCAEECTCVQDADCDSFDGTCTGSSCGVGTVYTCDRNDLDVTITPSRQEVNENDQFTVTCIVNLGQSDVTVNWTSPSGMEIDSNNIKYSLISAENAHYLTVKSAAGDDSGNYSCTAFLKQPTQAVTEKTAIVDIFVRDFPDIVNLTRTGETSSSLTFMWDISDTGNDILTCRANYSDNEMSVGSQPCDFDTECEIEELSPYTNYSVTIECRNKAGYSTPLAGGGRTLAAAPLAPGNVQVSETTENCEVTWTASESANGPQLFYQVMQSVKQRNEGESGTSVVVEVTKETSYSTEKENLLKNSEYMFSVCANNSEFRSACTFAEGSCITNTAAPEEIPPFVAPDAEKDVSNSSVTLTLTEVNTRNGPISCYEFVVFKRAQDHSGGGSPDEEVPFDQVKTAPEDDLPYRSVVLTHEEYSKMEPVTIGLDGAVSSCTLSGNNRRKRRSNMVDGNRDLVATNSPLSSDTQYDIFMRTYTPTDDGRFQYASSDYVNVMTLKGEEKGGGGGAPGGLIAFLILLILAVIIAGAVFIVWRKRNMTDKPDTENLPMEINNINGGGADGHLDGKNRAFEEDEMIAEVPPINIDQLGESILEKHKHNDKLFFAEFRSLMSTNPEATIEAFNNVSNKEKNRYINIPCYDHSRVKLNKIEDDENSDYINANYVDGYSVPEKFIAAQGPKEETVEDFWRMIWEQNTKTIIMLTKCFESGRDKCFQYWPDGGEVSYGKFTVCLDSTLECPDYVIRQLRISMNKEDDDEEGADEETEKRIVTQFHFLAWPDHGVPEYPYTMLAFIKRIRQMTQNKPEKGQIVIHCSAGVGRTGTYITIDAMLDRLKEQKTVDIFNYIQKIRLQRSTLVQSQVQYVFIYHALHEEHLYGHTEVKLNDLKQYFRRLKLKTLQDDNSPLHLEFKTAATLPVKDTGTKEASKPGNKEKNRIRNYLPYDKNRVSLERLVGDEDSTYINASYINGYERRNMYIITQAPMENTARDFWRMVWDSLTSTVVMLTDLEEKGNEMCVKFWPEEEPKTFGNLTIELADQEEEESFTIKDFTLSNNQGVSGRKVRMYQFHGWPEIGVPDCDSVTYLATVSHEYQKAAEEQESADQSKHPIIVFCHTGVGRTAIWCALSILLERAKAEGVVDVFQTVRTLRQQRQHMVQDTTQYEFLYQAVLSHLGKLDDMYENLQS